MWSVQTNKFRPVIMYCMVLWYFVIAVINSHLNTLRIKQYHRWGALSLPQGLSQGGPLPPVLLWDSQTGPPHFRPSNKGGLCAFKFEPAGGSIGHKHLLWACSLHWGGNRGFGGVHDSIGWHMGGIWCLDLAPRFTASYRVHHFDAMWGLHGAASKWSSYARRHSQIIPTQALVSWWAVCWWQAQSLVRQMGAVGHLGGTASLAALPKPSQTLQPCTFQIIVNPFNIFQHPKPSLHWAKALSFDGACKMLRGISALGVARSVRYQAVDLWLYQGSRPPSARSSPCIKVPMAEGFSLVDASSLWPSLSSWILIDDSWY